MSDEEAELRDREEDESTSADDDASGGDDGGKKSDLIPRLVTAIVAVPLLILIIFPAPAWAFFALAAVAGAISAWEYTSISYGSELLGPRILAAALTALVHTVFYFKLDMLPEVLTASVLAVFLYFLFFYDDQDRVGPQIGATVTGIAYASLLFAPLALLHRDALEAGPLWVVLALIIVWFSDTGAYFAGRAFGAHKLYEAVSPNKTWEGSIGGMLASVGGAFAANYAFGALTDDWTTLSVTQMLLVAVPANILGQLGDLCESLIKRCHGVKDSGTIIYGHGGMLDRIDALIFASPWLYYAYVHFIV